jgi:hypothetical protein
LMTKHPVLTEIRGMLEWALVMSHLFLLRSMRRLRATRLPSGRALAVCDRLRALSPDNPHLCHMPSHIDVLTGQYTKAIQANAAAVAADRKLVQVRRPLRPFWRPFD